jgi:hypothetical protein
MLRVRGLLVIRMPAGCESESCTTRPAMVPSQILTPGRASCRAAPTRAALGEAARSPCTCELTCGGLEGHLVDQAPSGPWMSPG